MVAQDTPTSRPKTEFVVSEPLEADAARIAQIHLAAMHPNPLLHAQFPTREARRNLERFLEEEHTAKHLRRRSRGCRGGGGFLVARDPATDVVAAFMRWESPPGEEKHGDGEDGEKLEASEGIRAIEGAQPEYLDEYARVATEAKNACFGGVRCYHLLFLCTDPAYEGQGAGSLLLRRVMDLAAADLVPVYLECTDQTVPFYEKRGFTVLQGFRVPLPPPGTLGSVSRSAFYEELCMAWYPPDYPGSRRPTPPS
ncbi:hypothetical protein VTK26DRAFT_6977 [Humicola hyalothermophila]